jgi:hypothetical protein
MHVSRVDAVKYEVLSIKYEHPEPTASWTENSKSKWLYKAVQ